MNSHAIIPAAANTTLLHIILEAVWRVAEIGGDSGLLM